MSEQSAALDPSKNRPVSVGNRAEQVRIDNESNLDRRASTRWGSNISLLTPLIVWSPVLALVFAACGVLAIIDILKRLVGIRAPIKPEDQIPSGAKLEDVVKYMKQDDLIARTRGELDTLFQLGSTPTIEEIRGVTDGRVLMGVFFPLHRFNYLKLINLPYFPWKGKVFRPINKNAGEGKNRMVIGPLKVLTFPFETKILPPLFGKNNVFTLDYAITGNPWWVRQVRDDMVKLKDGLFLGRANWKWRGGYVFLVYFTLRIKDY